MKHCGNCNARMELDVNFCTECGHSLRNPFPFQLSSDYVEFATGWHDGQSSALYSVASTGTIHNKDIVPALYAELFAIAQHHKNYGDELPYIEPKDLETLGNFIELAERFEFLFCRE